jgi:PAS domain S-box-containing protein
VLSQFIEQAPVAMAMFDTGMRYLVASGRWKRDFQLTGELIGRSHYEVLPELSDHRKSVHRRALAGETLSAEEEPFERMDGSVQWLKWEVRPWWLDDGAVGGIIIFIEDISDRRENESRLEAALREKDVLLSEVHHRVKNNLQVVHSLLHLQSAKVRDPVALKLLQESQHRIRSMALIHQTLYQSKDFAQVDFKPFLESLTPLLVTAYSPSPNQVELSMEVSDVSLPISLAAPCGLIVNELIANALKHGFTDGRPGQIAISLTRTGDDRVVPSVADNGVGVPEGLDVAKATSLGLQMVTLLTEQLGGTLQVDRANPTRFVVRFPVKP